MDADHLVDHLGDPQVDHHAGQAEGVEEPVLVAVTLVRRYL